MEFTVERADFLKELTLSQGVVERKTTIPILSNILLEASEDSLQMTATDLELGIRSKCSAKVKKGGSTTVPAKKLFDYVRQLEDNEIKCKATEAAGSSALQVSCGRSKVRMPGLAKENFPVLPEFPGKLAVLPPAILTQMIKRTAFAISSEESRYTLNAAMMILKPETMTMVATDGHRLAYVETDPVVAKEGYEGVGGELRVLVPKKAMTELQRLLTDNPSEGGIEFGKDDNHLFFRVGTRLLICRMLSGQFPNYEAVMPKANDKIATIEQTSLAAAVRRVSLFSDERSHAIRLHLDNDELKIVSSGSESGESEETMAISYAGGPLQIGFNWQYLLEFLAAADSEKVQMEFKDEQSAGQIRPASEEKLRYRYVVMPMRI
ncbi:MAG: DNA polymerase III subunit beta [Acidobacteria bacterium RIFCSPLOWO2_12_FULL_54_10]|nr:MAG: DNA polymerase III subunit beta [Acidobacteria bacterium RIFCSPLOWO2_12_FULL_54_10]